MNSAMKSNGHPRVYNQRSAGPSAPKFSPRVTVEAPEQRHTGERRSIACAGAGEACETKKAYNPHRIHKFGCLAIASNPYRKPSSQKAHSPIVLLPPQKKTDGKSPTARLLHFCCPVGAALFAAIPGVQENSLRHQRGSKIWVGFFPSAFFGERGGVAEFGRFFFFLDTTHKTDNPNTIYLNCVAPQASCTNGMPARMASRSMHNRACSGVCVSEKERVRVETAARLCGNPNNTHHHFHSKPENTAQPQPSPYS